MMTGRVIMTIEKGRQKVSLSHINRKNGDTGRGFLGESLRTSIPGFSPLVNKAKYLEKQLALRFVVEKENTLIQLCQQH